MRVARAGNTALSRAARILLAALLTFFTRDRDTLIGHLAEDGLVFAQLARDTTRQLDVAI
jgi:hypothetical protein